MVRLNERLIEKQGLSTEDVSELHKLHDTREKLFVFISDTLSSDGDRDALKLMSKLLESLEFDMQRVWKFSLDRNYHSHWLWIPYCTCPKIDNYDSIGTPYRIFDQGCPVHGDRHDEI